MFKEGIAFSGRGWCDKMLVDTIARLWSLRVLRPTSSETFGIGTEVGSCDQVEETTLTGDKLSCVTATGGSGGVAGAAV